MTRDLPAGEPASGARAVHVPIRDDALARGRALLAARLMIALYLVELLLNLTRPHVLADEPTLSIFQRLPGVSGSLGRLLATPRLVFWIMLLGIVAGAAIQVYAKITHPEGRRALALTWTTLAALLGPFALIPLTFVGSYPLTAMVCVPSTAFLLWLLHNGQRFVRVPLSTLLVAFGWGALIVFGLGRAYSGLGFGTINGYLGKTSTTDLGAQLKNQYRTMDLLILHLSAVNALVVATGVLLLLLMFRHRITDAVTGLVLGAAIGAGYNFVESVAFIHLYGSLSSINGATGGFEYWIRQSIGLFGGQVAFGALLGAGVGIAVQTRQRTQRRLVVGAVLLAAIGGAVATETISAWLSHLAHDHVDIGGTLDTLVISPFLWLLPQAPFIILAAVSLLLGTRARASAARAAISAEADAEGDAITREEAPFLIDPALRLWALVNTWRLAGRTTALTLHRLQAAQLDLAGWRFQQQGSADDARALQEGNGLRARVMRLKTRTGTPPAATP